MQKVASERWQRFAADQFLMRCSVQRVADYRKRQRGKMHANLMRAPRVQVRFDKKNRAKPQKKPPIRAGFAAFTAAGGHARAAAQVARDGQFDASFFPLCVSV